MLMKPYFTKNIPMEAIVQALLALPIFRNYSYFYIWA